MKQEMGPSSPIMISPTLKANRKNWLAGFKNSPAKPVKRSKTRDQGILLVLRLQISGYFQAANTRISEAITIKIGFAVND